MRKAFVLLAVTLVVALIFVSLTERPGAPLAARPNADDASLAPAVEAGSRTEAVRPEAPRRSLDEVVRGLFSGGGLTLKLAIARADGRPVAGIRGRLAATDDTSDQRSATSDADGEMLFLSVHGGRNYRVTITNARWPLQSASHQWQHDSWRSRAWTDIRLVEHSWLRAEFVEPGGVVRGRVAMPANARGGTITVARYVEHEHSASKGWLHESRRELDEDGSFRLDKIMPGRKEAHVRISLDDGCALAVRAFDLADHEHRDLGALTIADAKVTFRAAVTVDGQPCDVSGLTWYLSILARGSGTFCETFERVPVGAALVVHGLDVERIRGDVRLDGWGDLDRSALDYTEDFKQWLRIDVIDKPHHVVDVVLPLCAATR